MLQYVTGRAIRAANQASRVALGNMFLLGKPTAHLAACDQLSALYQQQHVALPREEHPKRCLDGPCRGVQQKAPGGYPPVPYTPDPSLDHRCSLRVGRWYAASMMRT